MWHGQRWTTRGLKSGKVTALYVPLLSVKRKKNDLQWCQAKDNSDLFKGVNLTACGWGKFIKKKKKLQSSNVPVVVRRFSLWETSDEKHLTDREKKQNTIGFSPHNDFRLKLYCRKLEKHTAGPGKTILGFCCRFCPQKNWLEALRTS